MVGGSGRGEVGPWRARVVFEKLNRGPGPRAGTHAGGGALVRRRWLSAFCRARTAAGWDPASRPGRRKRIPPGTDGLRRRPASSDAGMGTFFGGGDQQVGRHAEAGAQSLHHRHTQLLFASQNFAYAARGAENRLQVGSREAVLIHPGAGSDPRCSAAGEAIFPSS